MNAKLSEPEGLNLCSLPKFAPEGGGGLKTLDSNSALGYYHISLWIQFLQSFSFNGMMISFDVHCKKWDQQQILEEQRFIVGWSEDLSILF